MPNAGLTVRAISDGGHAVIDYTNWRGERSTREIAPLGVMKFGANEWHPDEQWMFLAHDIAKGEDRWFALSGVHSWKAKIEAPEMPWFPLRGDARITQRCATELCAGQPTWRLEAGGVGSVYCSGCMEKIESDPHWQAMHAACPACEADADIVDRLRVYSVAIGGGPGVITNAIAEIERLRDALTDIATNDWHKFNDNNALRYLLHVHGIACAALSNGDRK